MKQKLLSLLVLLMTVATGAWADGTCGDGVTWSLSGSTLTISGTGAMTDYSKVKDRPWHNDRASITSVVVGSGVTHIGNRAFQGFNNMTSVTLNEGLLTIGDYAFQGCNNASFTSITIPASVTSTGTYTFYSCENLATVTFSDGSNLTGIGDYTFNSCSALSSIEIPAGVTSIGKYAFNNCSALGSINIPAGVTSIDNYGFQNCSALGSINIPAGVTSIGNNAFSNCYGLATVTFSDGSNLTTIGNDAFYSCKNASFTSITIPASVTSIGSNAFSNCTYLSTVILNSNPFIHANAFYGISPALMMNLTANSAGGANWMTFYNQYYGFEADANTEVFKVALSGTALTMNKVANGIVDAGTAVVLKTTGGNPVMTITTTASGDTQDNSLTGVSAVAGVTSDGTMYVLNNGSKGVGFYKMTSGNTLGIGKAYLTYSGSGAPSFFSLDGNTTGIKTIDLATPHSLGENGQLTIDNYYNLAGQRVAQPTKGLYIVNGKKVVIK